MNNVYVPLFLMIKNLKTMITNKIIFWHQNGWAGYVRYVFKL